MEKSTPFCFKPTDVKIPNLEPGAKVFVADPLNSRSTLFIARGKYHDFLYRADPDLQQFTQVYTTRLCERISYASAHLTQKWVLIGILQFRDLSLDVPNRRTIFLDYGKKRKLEYPVSNMSLSPQYIAWSYEQDEPIFLFSNFQGKVQTFALNYDPLKSLFQVAQKREFQRYCFKTGVINQVAHTAFIVREKSGSVVKHNLIDKSRQDVGPREIPLPDIDINPNSEFMLFVSKPRKPGEPQVIRVILHATPNAIHAIIPGCGKFMSMPGDVPASENDQAIADSYDPTATACEPVSRLPFVCNFGEIVIIGAPLGFITGFLLDQLDRVRASFRIPFETEGMDLDLFKMRTLTENGGRSIYVESGEVFSAQINPSYFVELDPRFIIPILHCQSFNFASLISEKVLQRFWLGEVFHEMLLIEYIRTKNQKFGDKVCSTFAKESVYRCELDLFHGYRLVDSPGNSKQQVEELHNFREVSKVSKALLESVDIDDQQTLFSEISKLLDTEIFQEASFSEALRFHVFLQRSAIKFSLAEPASMIDVAVLPGSLNALIRKHWVARDLLPVDVCWPGIDNRDRPLAREEPSAMETAQRSWWSLRTKKINAPAGNEKAPAKMFELVEDLTSRMEDGAKFFRLHQYLLGWHLTDPLCGL